MTGLTIPASARVLLGIDVLRKNGFQEVRNSRVALITNHTGLDSRGHRTVDILHRAKIVDLVCILSPEHGFEGLAEHGKGIEDGRDDRTGVPIYSLYGDSRRPTDGMLKGVNTLVFDIQDVGTRFYTYITTMAMAMEEAAARGIRFVVLDRPNPIRGDKRSGDVLDDKTRRFTGYLPLPTRHGLTMGEIATWLNQKRSLQANLTVVKMENWKRNYWHEQTRQEFVPPSPNIPNVMSALLYSGIGAFEATNLSVGRGTERPFEVIGAPWVNEVKLCAALRQKNLPGVVFQHTEFVPSKDLYQGKKCKGVRILVTNRNSVDPFQIFLEAFVILMDNPAFEMDWEEVRIVTGSRRLEEMVKTNGKMSDLNAEYQTALKAFNEEIRPLLLY